MAVCETHHWAVSIWALAFAYMKPGMWLDEILIEFGSGVSRKLSMVVVGQAPAAKSWLSVGLAT